MDLVPEALEHTLHERIRHVNKSAYILIACIGLFIAGIVYYYAKPEPPKEANQPAEQAVQQANINVAFDGTSMFEEVNGQRSWELKAESITLDPNTKLTHLNNIKGSVFQEKGGKVEFTAKNAVFEPDNRVITMEGEIKAQASDSGVFTAEKANYYSKDKKFEATGKIKLIKDDTVITGDKLESDANMEKIKITGQAKVIRGGN